MAEMGDRYIVISTDGHCGGQIQDYKPYLDKHYHDDFESWAKDFHDGWAETDKAAQAANPDRRLGQASYEAPLNWESERRLKVMEQQGVVAEVLFPNTAPPFYPSGIQTTPAPRTPEEYEYRWAGLQAHNRWLADFCSDTPGRRAGLVQVFLDNVEHTVAEIRWAKEAGLMGVMLPGPHVLKMINLYYPEYDPIWAVCQELDMPVCIHDLWPMESADIGGEGAHLAGLFEINFYSRRQIGHLIAAAVFERFPDLKVAATELKDGSAVPSWLAGLDARVDATLRYPEHYTWQVSAARKLKRKPSEYFESNVFLAGPLDLLDSIDEGSPNLMFGADLPHAEGTWPYTTEVMRLALPRLSEEERCKFLFERQAYVYGFDLGFLQKIANEVGPLLEEVRKPISVNDLPNWPEETRCTTLSVGGRMWGAT